MNRQKAEQLAADAVANGDIALAQYGLQLEIYLRMDDELLCACGRQLSGCESSKPGWCFFCAPKPRAATPRPATRHSTCRACGDTVALNAQGYCDDCATS